MSVRQAEAESFVMSPQDLLKRLRRPTRSRFGRGTARRSVAASASPADPLPDRFEGSLAVHVHAPLAIPQLRGWG